MPLRKAMWLMGIFAMTALPASLLAQNSKSTTPAERKKLNQKESEREILLDIQKKTDSLGERLNLSSEMLSNLSDKVLSARNLFSEYFVQVSILIIKTVVVVMVFIMIFAAAIAFYLSRAFQKLREVYRTPILDTRAPKDTSLLVNPTAEDVKQRAREEGIRFVPFIIRFPADETRPEAVVDATAEVTGEAELPYVWFKGLSRSVRWRDRLSKASKIALREESENSESSPS